MKVAITGHRPEKINNWQFVEHQLLTAFQDFKTDLVIQGMAAGVDLVAAKCAYRAGIPFWCAKPWKTHKGRMGGSMGYAVSWESFYDQALQHAEKVIDVTDYENYPGAWIYQKRNEWMVDNADMVIAVWDGSSGGTANCVKYAKKKEVPIWQINPETYEVGWIAYGPQTKTLHQ